MEKQKKNERSTVHLAVTPSQFRQMLHNLTYYLFMGKYVILDKYNANVRIM